MTSFFRLLKGDRHNYYRLDTMSLKLQPYEYVIMAIA